MTEEHDRDELVELMSRYANMPDTQNWDELPRSVFCDEFSCDFSPLGAPVTTFSREAWCQRTKQAFAGWTATHHSITNHRIVTDGDRANHCIGPRVYLAHRVVARVRNPQRVQAERQGSRRVRQADRSDVPGVDVDA